MASETFRKLTATLRAKFRLQPEMRIKEISVTEYAFRTD